jgi:hypothetical protein
MYNPDLLKTTQTYFLPVFNTAVILENHFGDVLVPHAKGIYKVGDIYPSIIPSKQYFSQKINRLNQSVTTPIIDLNKINDAIVDEMGNIIIPRAMMLNKESYLRNEPTVPARGLILVELLVKRYIESISPYVKYSMYNNKIISNFKPEGVELFVDGHIDKMCESLYAQVSTFIANDVWFIYFVKYMGIDLIVEKSTDWRICEYYRMTNSISGSSEDNQQW